VFQSLVIAIYEYRYSDKHRPGANHNSAERMNARGVRIRTLEIFLDRHVKTEDNRSKTEA